MNKKNNKFIRFYFAVREILDDFRSDPKQYDLFARVYSFLVGGKVVLCEGECPPMGLRYGGIWYQPENLKEMRFYNWHEFDDLLTQAFSLRSLSRKDIVKLYKTVIGVNVAEQHPPKQGSKHEDRIAEHGVIDCVLHLMERVHRNDARRYYIIAVDYYGA